MSDKKISQLPAASDTDVGSSASYEIPVVVNGTTKKVSNSQVLAPVRQELQSTDSKLTQLSTQLSDLNDTIGVERTKSFDTIADATSYTLFDISVSAGDKISITFSGTAVWSRAYLFINSNVQKRIGDNAYQNNHTYEYTAVEDITSLSLRIAVLTTAGSVTVKVEKKGAIAESLDGKVDKVSGKALSSNDYTDADKATMESFQDVLKVENKEDDYVKADFSNENTIIGTNGVVRSGTNYITTELIELPSNITKIVAFAKFDGPGNSGLSFYNENEVPLANFVNVSTDKNYTIEADEIPEGAYYLRACQHNAYDAFVKIFYTERSGELIDMKEDVEEAKGKADKAVEFIFSPKIVNHPVNLHKSNLKILDIGNSFSNYPTMYIRRMINSAISGGRISSASDIAQYNLTLTGSQFKDWVDLYGNTGNTPYTFEEKADLGRIIEASTNTGSADGNYYRETCAAGDNTLLLKVLTSYKWDIILIHQRSKYSAEYKQWEGGTESGYLKQFIRIIKMYQPQASLGFTLVHSVSKNFSENTEGSTSQRWQHICEGVKFMQTNYGIDFVIPYGTALENLRKTSLNNADSELTKDLTHPGEGVAAYACNLVYFHCIYGQRYGLKITDDNIDVSVPTGATYPNGCIAVTDTTRPIAKRAALFAVTDMFTLHNPETETL